MNTAFRSLAVALTLLSPFSTAAFAADVKKDMPQVRIETTEGPIVVELNSRRAPKTVENFLKYVDDGFYTNTVFHRVMAGFMIQGGGFTQDLKQKPTRPAIQNEADNGLLNDRGTIAMARTDDPHSASAQFFINVNNNASLNFTSKSQSGWGYTVFGRVVEGMNVVDKIRHTPTGSSGPFMTDVPKTPVVIKKATRM